MAIYKIPDLGGASDVEVIEILVAAGDSVTKEQPLIVLETDKASMEIPADAEGCVSQLLINVGDKVSEGDDFIEYASTASEVVSVSHEDDSPESPTSASTETSDSDASDGKIESSSASSKTITIPDLGGTSDVTVIEICVTIGDVVNAEDTLIILESDKATMDIPAPVSGKIEQIHLKIGDQVNQGDNLVDLLASETAHTPEETQSSGSESSQTANSTSPPTATSDQAESIPSRAEVKADSGPPLVDSVSTYSKVATATATSSETVHAGPAVRMLARDLGVDLTAVTATGRRQRITKEDVQLYVKGQLQAGNSATGYQGVGLPTVPIVDHSAYGEISEEPLNAVKRATAVAMTTAMLNVPQVTQFDQADIVELEAFRQQYNQQRNSDDPKLSLVPIVMKALAILLARYPVFKASLAADGQSLIHKHYCHIGVAVNTPRGLLVPVIRDVDKLSIREIAWQLKQKAEAARNGKLTPLDMQGGCFTVSSLGGIGGTGFTPIVNPPQVAILGLSVASQQPCWDGQQFVPRLTLPLSLSYDHRAIDGAEAAEFCRQLAVHLTDLRRLLL